MNQFLASVEKRAFKMAVIATRNPDDALDVVQDAMMKLTEKYANHDPTDWPPLFHRVLQSKIMDWHRRTSVRNRWRVWFGRNDTQDDVGIENLGSDRSVTAERAAGNLALIDALEQALSGLPVRQNQAFLLRMMEGLDVAQTARAMGCSRGSVKTHLSRATQALRGALEDYYR